MKSTAKIILLCQTHAEPSEQVRKLAMQQGVPGPDRAHVVASRNVEFYAEGDSPREAAEAAFTTMGRFLATNGIDTVPVVAEERIHPLGGKNH